MEDTLPERDKFLSENEELAYIEDDNSKIEAFDVFNIWQGTLYKNKVTGVYSLFIETDRDESWIIIELKSR
jgi:hypothetical protein